MNTIREAPGVASAGLAVMAAGVPMYWWVTKKGKGQRAKGCRAKGLFQGCLSSSPRYVIV